MLHVAGRDESDRARTYLEACTSTAPTEQNLALVNAFADLLRGVLDGDDASALRDLVEMARQWNGEAHDLLAAAQFVVTEQLFETPSSELQSKIRDVAAIVRCARPLDDFTDIEGTPSRAVAG